MFNFFLGVPLEKYVNVNKGDKKIMTFNKKHCLVFLVIFVILILGMTMASATDVKDVNNTQKITDNKVLSTPAKYDVDKLVQSEANKISKDADEQTTDTTNNKDKEITKKTDTTTQKEAQQETATNYDTLKSILTSSTDEELTVTLDEGTYTGNGQITVNNAIKTLTIDGNGQTVNGNSMAFLKVENLDLTLKNIIITGCNNYDGSVLYQNGGQTTIINSTIKQNTLSSDGSSLGVIKVASGSLTLDNNTFDSNSVTTATTSRHGFIIHTTQTSKIVNNIFINNDCNDEPNGYAGLINRLVDEIHDNQYINNNLEVYVDVSFLDSRGQVVIDPQANFERDIEVKLSKNVYNDTVRNGTLRAAFGDTNPFSKDYEVIDGVAHVLITRNELNTHHLSYLADELEDVKLTFLPLDNSYEATVTENIRIVSEEGAEADDIIFEVSEYNRSVIAGENITIKGNISKKTGEGGWNDDYTEYIDYTEPFNDVLVKVIVNDKLTTCYARTNSSGDFVINCNATNVTPGQNKIYLNFKLDGPVVVNKIYDDSDELPVHVIGHTNITITAPDIAIGETIRIVTQVYNTETGNNASVGSTVNNKRFSITINDENPKYVKISGGKYTYSYTPSEVGTYNVSVTWAGTNYFLGSSNTTSFKVLPSTTNMTIINNNTIKIGQDLNVHGVLSTSSGAAIKNTEVNITVGSATFTGVTVDGNGRYNLTTPINELGNLTITVVYTNHTTGYSSSINTSNVNVLPKDTNMTINNNESIIVGQEVTINGTLVDELGEVIKNTYVNITVGTTPVNNVIVNENGFYETTCIVNEVGIINITVNYTSDNMNYTSSINTSDVTVIPRITNMTINNNESIFVGLQVNITGTLYDELGAIVPNTFVNITVGENIIKNVPVDENGNFSTLYQIDEIGEYPITVIYTNDTTRYYSSTNSSKVTVNPRNTYTVIDDTESVYIGQNVTIKGTLYDELDEIVPNTIVTIRIDENYINENVIVDDEGKFELSYNATSVGEHNINVIYTNDTTRYINSTNKSEFTVNPRTTNMTIEYNSPIRVGEILTVSGYLTDNLGEKVTNTIVNVTVGTAKNSNVIVDGNGYYETQFTLTQNGTYDIIVEYINHSSNYVRSTNTTVYELYKIPTVTNVTIIEDRVYMVTIDVVVKANDTSNESIESGYLNITVNGESKLYPVTGQTTRIILDSNVNITTTDEVDFKVEYVENDKYLNSTGINSTNDEVITKFTARALNTNLTINVSPDPQNITDDINITGQVIDELGNIIQNGKVIISINGTSPETVPFVDGEYKYTYHTNVAGIIPFNVTYVGEKTNNGNILINESINSSTFTVEKLPTTTKVELVNSTSGKVTINVKVENNNKQVTIGALNITVAGITVPYNIEDAENGNIIISDIPEFKDLLLNGNVSIQVSYNENDYYLSSTDKEFKKITVSAKEITIKVEADETNTVLDEKVTINGTIITPDNMEGKTIFLNITGIDTLVPVTVDNNNGFTYEYTATILGTITVNASYTDERGIYNNASDKTSFTVNKIPTSTTLTFENTTIGNVVVNVKVNANDKPVTTGHVVIVDSTTGEVLGEDDLSNGERNITLNIVKTGTISVNATYNENDKYQASNDTANTEVAKLNSSITINIVDDTLTIGENLVIYGTLTDSNGKIVTTGNVTVTINGTDYNTTINNGEYKLENITSTAGTFPVNATFTGNTNITGKTSNTLEFKVDKKLTTTTITVVSNNVESISINVAVTDKDNKAVTSGTLKVTTPTETITLPVNGTTTNIPINTNTTIQVTVEYLENSEYKNSSSTEEIAVTKQNTTITVNVTTPVKSGQEATISGVLLDKNNLALTGAKVEIKVDGEAYKNVTTDDNGKYNTTISESIVGTHNVEAKYAGNDRYVESTDSTSLTVEKLESKLTINSTKPVKVDENVEISGKLLDENNKAINGATVQVNYGGNIQNVTTDKDGNYKTSFPVTSTDEKTITATYIGNNTYDASQAQTTSKADKNNASIQVNLPKDAKVGQPTNITGTITNNEGKPVANMPVTVDVNGKPVRTVTDENGNFRLEVNPSEGTNTIKVSAGDKAYKSDEVTTKFNATKSEAKVTVDPISEATQGKPTSVTGKVTDEDGKPLANMPVTVDVNGRPVRTVTDDNGNFRLEVTPTEGTNTIKVNAGDKAYKSDDTTTKFTAHKPEAKVTINQITDKKVGEPVTITGKLVDDTNKAITNAPVKVTVNNNTITAITGTNGNYQITTSDTLAGTNNVTVKYEDTKYDTKTAKTTFKATKTKVKVTVLSINGTLGEEITLTARITDEKGRPVNGGNLVFKMNGKTLRTDGKFNSNSTPYKFKVENGIVTYTMTADKFIRDGKNLTASYSGSYKYEQAKANTASVNIRKRTAQATVTVTPKKTRQNNDIVFTATLKDVTSNARNKTCLTENASLIFKLNGITIKDSKGQAQRLPVTSSVVNYVYHVSTGMGGYDSNGLKNYTVEAVYDNPVFYPGTRNSSVFHVERSEVKVNFIKTTIKRNVLSVKATFKDFENKYLVGTNKVCVKINGKTYQENGKVKYFNVKNGRVDLKGIKISSGQKVKEVMLVTGAREGYLGARATTTDITFN